MVVPLLGPRDAPPGAVFPTGVVYLYSSAGKLVLLRCEISFFVCVDDRLMLCGCRSPGGPLEIGLTLLGQL